MEVVAQLIIHKNCYDHIHSILESHSVRHSRLQTFSSTELDTIILLLDHMPWKELAAIIGSFCYLKGEQIKAKAKRKVVLMYADNSKIELNGDYTIEEIEKISHPHKQLYISMYEEKSND